MTGQATQLGVVCICLYIRSTAHKITYRLVVKIKPQPLESRKDVPTYMHHCVRQKIRSRKLFLPIIVQKKQLILINLLLLY